MSCTPSQINIGRRTLMGPGPSDAHPRILSAMAQPLLGHLDPAFLALMEEVKAMLRQLFRTANAMTLPISGTGTAGMEACLVNVLEPGDTILIGMNGYFGDRLRQIAERCGATVASVVVPWGGVCTPEQIAAAVAEHRPKVVALVHAETSTGALQPLEGMADIVHDAGALLLADTVTSLAGTDVRVDDWGIDIVYSGTQKCIGAPPGLSPISFNERAMQAVRARRHPAQSWYLDLGLLESYWTGAQRVYHHTAPITAIYGLHEALRIIFEEGLEARFARHRSNHAALVAGLAAMEIEMHVRPELQLPMLSTVCVPDGIDEAAVRSRLLQDFGIEIGGGLGELKGRVWRVGLMGYTSNLVNVLQFLMALGTVLAGMGRPVDVAESLAAARQACRQ